MSIFFDFLAYKVTFGILEHREMLQTDFQKVFWWFTADLGKLVELGWQKYSETENCLLTTYVQLLGQILVLPPSYWYRWKALEKFALRK